RAGISGFRHRCTSAGAGLHGSSGRPDQRHGGANRVRAVQHPQHSLASPDLQFRVCAGAAVPVIARWLSTTYQDGGREFPQVDCWGLVRVARADLGYPELPAWGAIAATDKRGMTKAYGASVGDWEQVP